MGLKKLVAGNWKMNGSLSALEELKAIAQHAESASNVDILICPPATLISPAAQKYRHLSVGAQDCHWAESGAHTGCLSIAMLKEAGAQAVIIGHSERRQDNHETDDQVRQKAQAAIAGGVLAIICVGETEAQRDAAQAESVVTAQVANSVPSSASGDTTVVAYEPVWAIGTGRTPSAQDVADMHAAIRSQLVSQFGDEGNRIRILYGGSVKASNADELLQVANVDGALVGGASLKADDFIPIIAAA